MGERYMKNIEKISEISARYDNYIVDVTGVIHDGVEVYPNAVLALNNLRKEGKNIVFLSNSSHISNQIKKRIIECGIEDPIVMSSGEFVLADINAKGKILFPSIMEPCYVIGDSSSNMPLIEHFNVVHHLEEAKFIYFSRFFSQDEDVGIYDSILQEAVKMGLPALCSNADDYTVHGEAYYRRPQGALAKRYQNMGGNVIYYGKPYPAIYDYILQESFKCPLAEREHFKKRALAIGDNVNTDIRGARNWGIDSLLLLQGNLREERLPEQKRDKEMLGASLENTPNYIAQALNY